MRITKNHGARKRPFSYPLSTVAHVDVEEVPGYEGDVAGGLSADCNLNFLLCGDGLVCLKKASL